MTTPTDPTTLRTALEAWLYEHAGNGHTIHAYADIREAALGTIRRVAYLRCANDQSTHNLLTTAPAADEARCAFVGCGGVRDDVFHEPCLPGGAFHDHKACHPFQPAPTPAQTTPPATEPVAALVACRWRPEPCLADPDDWRHRRCLPEGDPCPDPCPAMPGCHPYTPPADRVEVDVERLAKALHDQGFGCNAYRCSLGRGSSADAHEQDARFLAVAYRETADDR